MEALINECPSHIRCGKGGGGFDILLDKNNLINIDYQQITYQFQKKYASRASYIESVRRDRFRANDLGFIRWILAEFCSVENSLVKNSTKYVHAHIKRKIEPTETRELKIVVFDKKYRDTVRGVDEYFPAGLLSSDHKTEDEIMSDHFYEKLLLEIITLTEVNNYIAIGIYSFNGIERAEIMADILKKEFYPKAKIVKMELRLHSPINSPKNSPRRPRSKAFCAIKPRAYCMVKIDPKEKLEPVKIEFLNKDKDKEYKFLYDKRTGTDLEKNLPTYFFVIHQDKMEELKKDDLLVSKFLDPKHYERTHSLGFLEGLFRSIL